MIRRICACGSKEESQWFYDARGIPLFRACDICKHRKLAKYRPEVLSDSNYAANEEIEPDYDYWDQADTFGDE